VIALIGVRAIAPSSCAARHLPRRYAFEAFDLGVDLAKLQVQHRLAGISGPVIGGRGGDLLAQRVDASAQRHDLRCVFGIDRQLLGQFPLQVAQLALVVGQHIVIGGDLAGRLVDLDDACTLVDQRGQLALCRGTAFLKDGLPAETEGLVGRQRIGVFGLELADLRAAIGKFGRQALHLVFEEVERAFGAPGPQLHIGRDDPCDVFVDHVGGDLTRTRLETHGNDRSLVPAATALDRGHLLHLLDHDRRVSVECHVRKRRTRWRYPEDWPASAAVRG
jgi:hypothetical protein